MEHLYAPWRDEYVKNSQKVKGCVFCHILNNPNKDEENRVVLREKDFFIVMNKYPYTPGHFLIIPNFHTDALENLKEEIWLEMNKFAYMGVKVLKKALRANGVNIGINLGKIAGAGIAEHIHLHLVPRYERDTNFITSIADTRIYSTDFDRIFRKVKKLFEEIKEG